MMGKGGARPGAGRPFGSRDAAPRPGKHYNRIKAAAVEYDSTEFFVTNAEKVFKGNSRELLVAIYKAEQLPVRVRLYAAVKAADYEIVPPISDGTPKVDAGEALIAAINRLRFTEEDFREGEVMPPPLPKPRVRPKPGPVSDVESVADTDTARTRDRLVSETRDVERCSELKAADIRSGGGPKPDSEPARERTAEEWRDIAGTPIHLRPGFGRRGDG